MVLPKVRIWGPGRACGFALKKPPVRRGPTAWFLAPRKVASPKCETVGPCMDSRLARKFFCSPTRTKKEPVLGWILREWHELESGSREEPRGAETHPGDTRRHGRDGGRREFRSGRRRWPKTLPRHLHRFVLRLLRPAEAATRRLIIIAARGLVVKIRPHRPRKPKPVPEPKTIYVLDRVNGSIVSVPVVLPEPVHIPAPPRPAKRSPTPAFPLFDPFKRFGIRRRYAKPSAMPSIRLLGGDDDPIVPFFRRPEPAPPPPPRPPSPDDPLDAGVSTGGSKRSAACWTTCRSKRNAWRAGRLGAMRDGRGNGMKWTDHAGKIPPHRLALRARHLSPISWGRAMGAKLERRHRHRDSSPPRSGGEVARAKPETERG